MATNWTSAVDMCAASGILDYDAAADILGQKPRFVGNPILADLPKVDPKYLPADTKIKTSPDRDIFGNPVEDDGNFVQNPTWKKVLTGALVTGGVGAGIAALFFSKGKFKMPDLSKLKFPKIDFSAIKSKIKLPKFRLPKFSLPKFKMPKFSNIGSAMKNGAATAWNFIKKPFITIAKVFKR